MKKNWKLIFGITALFMALFALPSLLQNIGFYGVMDSGGHRSMMGFSHLFGSFMGLGMQLVWLVPLGLLIMAVYGVVRLANQPTGSVISFASSAAPTAVCPHCDKAVDENWVTCPYCDSKL